jgi:hypothetical protein
MILCFGALLSGAARAEPADYIYVPTVEQGEREIDFKAGSARSGAAVREQASSIGFGYGAGERWFTEVYLKYAGGSGDPTHYDAFEWENKFQLTETGKYPVDVGLITELERPRRLGEPAYEFRFGPLLQSEFGKVQVNGNLLFERRFRSHSEAADVQHYTEIGYQWQVKYRWQQAFEYGMQGFGEMGKWNDWDPHDAQTHRFGPAVFGKLPLGNRQAIEYNAAWLIGAALGAPDHTFRMQMEYEF